MLPQDRRTRTAIDTASRSIWYRVSIDSLYRVSPSSRLHLCVVILIALEIHLQRLRDGMERHVVLIQIFQSFRGSRPGAIDGEELDAVTRGRDVEIPVPDTGSVLHKLYSAATTYQADLTKVGCVLSALSHVRQQNSSQPSASTGTSILQIRQPKKYFLLILW